MATASLGAGQLLALGAPALVVGLVWRWRSRLPLVGKPRTIRSNRVASIPLSS